MSLARDTLITRGVIVIGICLYLYILIGTKDGASTPKFTPFILEPVSKDEFSKFIEQYQQFHDGGGDGGMNNWGNSISNNNIDDMYSRNQNKNENNNKDDFFFDAENANKNNIKKEPEIIIPSKNFYCTKGWVMFFSKLNYKYLWMHEKDTSWMSATAPYDTGVHHKAFELLPVTDTDGNSCSDGWVKLRAYDHKGFVAMNGPQSNSDSTWIVQVKSEDESVANLNPDYHFLLEKDGFLLNKGSLAFVNVINNPDYPVRGHGADYFIERTPAVRETGAQIDFMFLNQSVVEAAHAHQNEEEFESIEEDNKLKKVIQSFKKSFEKRVISFGLYGRNPKYTMGAIKNTELVSDYFPGWICRFYVASDVPEDVISELKTRGAEIQNIPDGIGYVAGMFWRFMIADDPSVDRYIIRDTDSRLNARDAIAVQEWILSKRLMHIERDHVNHCIPMNGGMWGGKHGAISSMESLIKEWYNKDEYGADLHFLEDVIYPIVEPIALQHDSYCCDKYPGARPYPSKRYPNYQHIGQVFDAQGEARLTDIDGFIRGVPVPHLCRKRPEHIYG